MEVTPGAQTMNLDIFNITSVLSWLITKNINLHLVCCCCCLKVGMLTHTYPHKRLRKVKLTPCNHQADSPHFVWPDVWSGHLQVLKRHGHAWHWMPLLRPGVIKQHRSKLNRQWDQQHTLNSTRQRFELPISGSWADHFHCWCSNPQCHQGTHIQKTWIE